MQTSSQPSETAAPPARPPTFLFIGGQRCASTWVHRALEQHAEVLIAPTEVHFFDLNYDKGVQWYLDHFRPGPQHKAWGDKTPAYLTTPEAPQRVSELSPDARLICCLRNPIDRAYSLYNMRQFTRDLGTFEEALERDPRILDMGLWAEHLERWFDVFPREQMLVMLYDDLQADEPEYVRRIYAHIGVDPDFKPQVLGKKVNAALFPRLRHTLRRMGMEPAVRAVGRSWIGGTIRRWNHARSARTSKPMSPATRARLIEYYRRPNRRLEELLGTDLAAWSSADG